MDPILALAAVLDFGSLMTMQKPGSQMPMQGLGPWILLGLNYLGPIWVPFGALFIWGPLGPIGAYFYLFGAHFGPWDPFGGARWPHWPYWPHWLLAAEPKRPKAPEA